MNMMLAQVVAVNHERRTVDLVCCQTRAHYPEVSIAAMGSGTDHGLWDLPSVPRPGSEAEAGGINKSGRTIMAVCGAIFGRPIVIGFLRANDSQMAFNQADRTVWRHASGTYATAAPDGSLEIHHPGGAYFRIGSGDGHEDLAPISADGNWSLPEASGATIVLETKAKDDNGNAKGFKLVITPSGDATVTTDGKVTMTAEDDVRIESKKKVDIVSGGNMTLSVSGRLVANVTGHAGILLNAGYDIQVHSSHGAILEDAAQIIENGAVVSTR